ncbi:GAF domain protein [Solidesulfovibrio carbinoliphilus subsp. oakridgensis]|uniref:GAF domain protein n=1 Tax=Solidesulfovibrio carbinoliphilus subsp. oakridgensis TaxID=694327 RepID=G7Q8G7_9BACT|nr:histidine kinase [Solidesulfovibrio carbinoliphilus]EHJ48579.1 GAF domain protein [Solidesulfovibrio carbinoliphilus subsp. oakridgensis]
MTLKSDCCLLATPLLLTGFALGERLQNIIGSAPPAVRVAIADLMLSIKTSLDVLPVLPSLAAPETPVTDWESMLTALTSVRRELDIVKAHKIEDLRRANPGFVQLEYRFGLLKKAHDKAKLMLEILYELINAGQDFQAADEILEQSAEIMLKELKADLYVCRLRDDEGQWVNIAANTHTGRATPIFVRFMEETLPYHPVMRSVADPEALFVVSNNLQGPERGGESIDCVPYLEGFRCRLSFFLREPDGNAFGLIMLYSKKPKFFDRYEADFLADCARIVSLTVGRRLELGRDALAKAAGGMAHVGNNVLAIIKNGAELILEDCEDFLDNEDEIATGLINEAMQLVPGPWPPLAPAALRHLFGLTVERMEVEKKMQYVNLIVENVNRLRQAIANLLKAVENPILMPYIGGEEVLDLEPGEEDGAAS